MAANFDPFDKNSWYFGPMKREEATELLNNERETGVFLVRNSSSIQGDLVLCVRENSKVSHYIINCVPQGQEARFRMGDQLFPDIPSLLNFYKLHYLDTTPLIRPAVKKVEIVIAKYDFQGSGDADDLLFKKGEILTIVSKDEEQWWTARNILGQIGSIPVPYIEKIDESTLCQMQLHRQQQQQQCAGQSSSSPVPSAKLPVERISYKTPNSQRKLPALAQVIQTRVPNAYDKTALKLNVGDVVKVTKININGQWEGELKGKVGHFPFTHVEFIDTAGPEKEES